MHLLADGKGEGAAAVDSGKLTQARALLVNNTVLAEVCARSGLYKHLRVDPNQQAILQRPIDGFVKRCCEREPAHGAAAGLGGKEEGRSSAERGVGDGVATNDDGKHPVGRTAPKMLPDLVEAVLGGVMLDAGAGQCGKAGSLDVCWDAYCSLVRAAGMDGVLRL